MDVSRSKHNYGCWIKLGIFFNLGSNYESQRFVMLYFKIKVKLQNLNKVNMTILFFFLFK